MSYQKPVRADYHHGFSRDAESDVITLYGKAGPNNIEAVKGRRVLFSIDIESIHRMAERYPRKPA